MSFDNDVHKEIEILKNNMDVLNYKIELREK